MMPKMSGMDLYEWLEKEYPLTAKKIIFISGGAFTERGQQFLDRIGNRKIEKPFTKASLEKLILQLKWRHFYDFKYPPLALHKNEGYFADHRYFCDEHLVGGLFLQSETN